MLSDVGGRTSRPRDSAAGGCPVFVRCCLHPPPPDGETELHPSPAVLRRRSDAAYSPSAAAPVRTPPPADSPPAAPPAQIHTRHHQSPQTTTQMIFKRKSHWHGTGLVCLMSQCNWCGITSTSGLVKRNKCNKWRDLVLCSSCSLDDEMWAWLLEKHERVGRSLSGDILIKHYELQKK